VSVTYHARFSPTGDGGAVWQPMVIRGELMNQNTTDPAASGERLASAVAVTFTLAPGEERSVPFVLSWDLPIMQFGSTRYFKRYTKFFGRSGRNAWAIAREGLLHESDWSRLIDDWQRPYLADTRTPTWYKTALFNELYALVDNGTAWDDGTPGHFSYLECFDYAFYSTLDVEAYASFALAQLFPDLDKLEARDFARGVEAEDLTPHEIGWNKEKKPRKLKGATPMDLGIPYESPWVKVANYAWQDTNALKDESANLVLKVWRDYVITGRKDEALLRETWPHLRATLAYAKKFDTDGDGLSDSVGVPDQTYDSWNMTGPSAYLGGLTLASLSAAIAIANVLGDRPAAAEYTVWLEAARKSYEAKLWNGSGSSGYYDFDTGSKDHKAVMADQLFGQFYAQMTGLPDIVPREHRDAALKTVMRLNAGPRGVVNGVMPDGSPDNKVDERSNAPEVWTGVNYALAAFLYLSGMTADAWKTAEAIYRTTYESGGLWFRTPESWAERNGAVQFRASMYMRPLAIWAIQYALNLSSSNLR
jgi:non-lysosomal glucosylceramidase